MRVGDVPSVIKAEPAYCLRNGFASSGIRPIDWVCAGAAFGPLIEKFDRKCG
jgi:hypothetical protein